MEGVELWQAVVSIFNNNFIIFFIAIVIASLLFFGIFLLSYGIASKIQIKAIQKEE